MNGGQEILNFCWWFSNHFRACFLSHLLTALHAPARRSILQRQALQESAYRFTVERGCSEATLQAIYEEQTSIAKGVCETAESPGIPGERFAVVSVHCLSLKQISDHTGFEQGLSSFLSYAEPTTRLCAVTAARAHMNEGRAQEFELEGYTTRCTRQQPR